MTNGDGQAIGNPGPDFDDADDRVAVGNPGPALDPEAGADAQAEGPSTTGVTPRTLLVVGILVVVLAFLAGFIGARMGSPAAPDPANQSLTSPPSGQLVRIRISSSADGFSVGWMARPWQLRR